MARLIDLDEAISKVRTEGILRDGYSDREREDDVCEMLESCAIVDAVKVVYCDECCMHDNCSAEMAFQFARVKKPFCCVGRRKSTANSGAKMDEPRHTQTTHLDEPKTHSGLIEEDL